MEAQLFLKQLVKVQIFVSLFGLCSVAAGLRSEAAYVSRKLISLLVID
jgi:hypothetical protein